MKRIFLLLAFMLLPLLSLQAAVVDVSWNANTEADLAGYKLYYGTASGVYGLPVDVGKVTSYSVTVNPKVTTTYYVTLTAYDMSGNESPKSDEASITVTVADTTPPAKPTGLKMVIQQLLSWLRRFWA